MALTYRTTDGTRWGAGKGSDLTATEVDRNFWDLRAEFLAAVAALEDPDVISNIEVIGSQMTIFTAAGESFGPFTLPVAMLHWRGAWTAATAYSELDIVRSAPHGTFLVLLDHTSDATAFDPLEVNGSAQPLYYQLLPPSEGESQSFLDSTDMPDVIGTPGQILVVNPAADAMIFEDPPDDPVWPLSGTPSEFPPSAHDHTMDEISDLPASVAEMPPALGTALQVLRVDAAGTGLEFVAPGSVGGVDAFTDLSDVPSDYSGDAGKLVAVNGAGDGLEFVPVPGMGDFQDLGDVPAAYTGHGGKLVAVTDLEDGLEFIDPAAAGAESLDELSDVALGTPDAGDVLKFNGSEWAALPPDVAGDGSVLKIVALTQTAYDALTPVATTFYIITGP